MLKLTPSLNVGRMFLCPIYWPCNALATELIFHLNYFGTRTKTQSDTLSYILGNILYAIAEFVLQNKLK